MLILAARHNPDAVTVNLTINFLPPARGLPLLAEAVPLRGGRRLFTAEVRIVETTGAGALVAQATTTWALTWALSRNGLAGTSPGGMSGRA